jgi:signal transduction histidine kinase
VAHELNQPLAAIMSNAQAAQHFLDRETPDIEEVKEALTDIISDDKRAGDVINRLRKLLIKTEPEKELFNFVELIQDVLRFVKNEAQNKGVVIIFEEYEAALPQIEGDRVQLQQVMLNLILNALDAMAEVEKQKRTLEIKAFQNDEGNMTVQFIDNGIGFEGQNINRIFDAFYTSKQSGMGMGLTISRTIIEAHGGKLGALQNKEAGATFYFSLSPISETPA